MAQTTYQKIEEYIDLMIARGYSADYILEQLETKKDNLVSRYEELEEKANNANGDLDAPIYLLSDFLKERRHPKPAYLSDMSIHPVVRRYFEALYSVVDDYELYLAPPCNSDEFIAIEENFEIKLPKALKDFYLITNGGSEMMPTFYWYPPIELKYLINWSKEQSKYHTKGNSYYEAEMCFKSLKPMIFTGGDSADGLWFDFDTSLENGMEVVEIGADVYKTFITKSFEELLNNISECMEKPENIIVEYYPKGSQLEWQLGLYEVLRLDTPKKIF